MSASGGIAGILIGLAGSAAIASALGIPFIFQPGIVVIAVLYRGRRRRGIRISSRRGARRGSIRSKRSGTNSGFAIISVAMSNENSQRDASRTALGVAAIRAVHQQHDGEPKILEDFSVRQASGGEALIAAHLARAEEKADRDLRIRVVLRSRYAEDRLALARERGVRQCVILGAGFDTFAYRQPAWAKDLRLFEVDHCASQSEKRQRLDAAGISIPPNLEFVDIDFERVSLRDGLRRKFARLRRAGLFFLPGVLVYLTRDAADAIFRLVAEFPAGSEIVFTYAASGAHNSPIADRVRAAGRTLADAVRTAGVEARSDRARDSRRFNSCAPKRPRTATSRAAATICTPRRAPESPAPSSSGS